MNKRLLVLILLFIILGGGFLRFYKLDKNPPSLTGDEISFGYSAYSILLTGKDEHGKFLPLVLRSVGDYKNPLPAYLMIIPIKLFGLNDFSIRFQNAFFGTLMIFVYFLFLNRVIKSLSIAIVATTFISFSLWHIFYSRFAYEPLVASFFILLGIWFFIKMLEGRVIWAFFSAFFLTLTMYTAFAPRLFIPIFIFVATVFNIGKLKKNSKNLVIFILTCILFGLPLLYLSLFEKAGTRFSMVFLGNDVEFKRYVILGEIENIKGVFLLFFFWIKRYLSYLSPEFLFTNGLAITMPGTLGLGLLYSFELPWLILGVIEFIKRKIPHKEIFTIWLLIGVLPDSLTNNQQHAGRLLHVVPVVILITALGAIKFYQWVTNLKSLYSKFLFLFYPLLIVIVLAHAFLTYVVHFPRAKGEAFDEGMREAVQYIKENHHKYKEVIFDPRRGLEGPYLISNPYLYFLFYTQYDPSIYQTERRISSKDESYYYSFNKYVFRPINWTNDTNKLGVLFIGSPWSFAENSFKEGELLEKIYMSNGKPAFYIVSPKPK